MAMHVPKQYPWTTDSVRFMDTSWAIEWSAWRLILSRAIVLFQSAKFDRPENFVIFGVMFVSDVDYLDSLFNVHEVHTNGQAGCFLPCVLLYQKYGNTIYRKKKTNMNLSYTGLWREDQSLSVGRFDPSRRRWETVTCRQTRRRMLLWSVLSYFARL